MDSLSPEQRAVLRTTINLLNSIQVYLAAIAPWVSGVDEEILKGMDELIGVCLRNIPKYFPGLEEKRGDK